MGALERLQRRETLDEIQDTPDEPSSEPVMSPELRRAVRSDAQALAEIRRDAILALAPVYGSERARVWADSSAGERVQRALEENEVWVAERASGAVGWVEIDRDRIEGLYVRSDLSGAGIGSALLLHAEGVIRSAGHRAVALDASWNAEEFYLRRGYHAQAERPADAGRPMRKPLRGSEVRYSSPSEVE